MDNSQTETRKTGMHPKDVVLEFVDELESEIQDGETIALEASHDEDVSEWMGAIQGYLESSEGAVSFSELVRELGMSVVVVWLGILLGRFEVQQAGGFYDEVIWVG